MPSISFNYHKEVHEQFVSGHSGGPVYETYILPLAIVLGIAIQYRMSMKLSDGTAKFLNDFLFNWLVVLASVTFYANNLFLLLFILVITLLFMVLTKSNKVKENQDNLEHKNFLTNYRSAMMVLTMTSILAVDFKAFPRRFAKTETWGTSLMDLGVGSFVFSLGVVSCRKELKNKVLPFKSEVYMSIKQTLKVFALGVVRLVSVKGLDYQEHVTEYGVHWNFFFTLSLLPLFFVFIRRMPLGYCFKGVLITLGYELVLKNTNLQRWALSAPRVNLISQNKEGLVSFIGYLAIFTFGYALGMTILNPATTKKQIVVKCAKWGVLAQVGFAVFTLATEPSRRLANMPYVVWVVAFNSFFIGVMALFLDTKPSPSYLAVNKFGETMFVVSNLATGAVNMSVDTVSQNRQQTLMVLGGYLLFLFIFALVQSAIRTKEGKKEGRKGNGNGRKSGNGKNGNGKKGRN